MGTPAFAVPSLEALLRLETVGGRRARLVGVFTQPDRPAGRGKRLIAPPVKVVALGAGVSVFQPERLRRPEGMAALSSLEPELIVVAAYAQILPRAALDLPRFGCLNVHASLLPRYRGASPIQAAILDGERETGVSLMLMDEGLDTGSVIAQAREPIGDEDTAESLSHRLALAGAGLLVRTLPAWVGGELTPQPQDNGLATMTRPLTKEEGRIDWSRPATYLARHIRAMHPWPGAFTTAGEGILKVLAAAAGECAVQGSPGTLLRRDGWPAVVTGEGELILRIVQPEGRRAMDGAAWLRGAGAPYLGTVLGAGMPSAQPV
jgi:methionyl-tRNA formyltransferase